MGRKQRERQRRRPNAITQPAQSTGAAQPAENPASDSTSTGATASHSACNDPGRFPKHTNAKHHRLSFWVKRAPALLVWGFILLKLFVYDIDTLVLQALSPRLVPLRLFLVVGAILLAWQLLGTKQLVFTAFYPIILLVDLLVLAVRSQIDWTALVVLGPFIRAMFTPIRRQVWTLFLATVACLLIWLNLHASITLLAMTYLLFYLARHYRRQFSFAFVPGRLIGCAAEYMETTWRAKREESFLRVFRAAKSLSPGDPERDKQELTNLASLLQAYALLFAGAKWLKQIEHSSALLVCSMVPLTVTVLLTVVVFAFEYLALNALSPQSFSESTSGGIVFFLFFSFTTFLTANSGDFAPVTPWAWMLTSLELVCTVLTGVILVFVFTSVIREQSREQLSRLAAAFEEEAEAMTNMIAKEHALSVADAAARVREKKPEEYHVVKMLMKGEV